MKRSLLRWGSLLMLLMALPALACNLVSGGEADDPSIREEAETPADSSDVAEEANAGVEEIAPTPANSGEEVAGSGPPFPELSTLEDALGQFDSYRMQVDMRFEGIADTSNSGTMTMVTARTVEPPATSVEMSLSGSFAEDSEAEAGGVTLTFVEVGDQSYSVIPGVGCISGLGSAEATAEFDSVFEADDLVNEINDPEYVGEESINGVATNHYRFDESNLSQADQELRDVRGDIYVSQEHAYVVRMVFDAVGEIDGDEQPAEGNMHFELNVLDVDQPITIEAPADCESANAEYPVMDGAAELASFAGLTTYSINAPLEDVVTFYQDEMALRGYQMSEDSFFTESTALMTFTAEGQPSVTVTLGAEGEEVAVLITSAEN